MACDACSTREPQAPQWPLLLGAYKAGRLDARTFHDAFLDTWTYARDHDFPEPQAIADLFFVVEDFTPDPALGDTHDTTEIELQLAVEQTLLRLEADTTGDMRL